MNLEIGNDSLPAGDVNLYTTTSSAFADALRAFFHGHVVITTWSFRPLFPKTFLFLTLALFVTKSIPFFTASITAALVVVISVTFAMLSVFPRSPTVPPAPAASSSLHHSSPSKGFKTPWSYFYHLKYMVMCIQSDFIKRTFTLSSSIISPLWLIFSYYIRICVIMPEWCK